MILHGTTDEDSVRFPWRTDGIASRRKAGLPFAISILTSARLGGVLGLAGCPGVRGGRFRVDWLQQDLDEVTGWSPSAVVSLVGRSVPAGLDIGRLGFEVRRRGVGWLHLPMLAAGRADAAEAEWRRVGGRLGAALQRNARVLLHGTSGIGAGRTLALRLLTDAGATAAEAGRELRAACPGG